VVFRVTTVLQMYLKRDDKKGMTPSAAFALPLLILRIPGGGGGEAILFPKSMKKGTTYKHFVEDDDFPSHDGPSKVSKMDDVQALGGNCGFPSHDGPSKYQKGDDVQALRGKWWFSESRRSFQSIKKGTTYKYFVGNDGFPSHDGPSKV